MLPSPAPTSSFRTTICELEQKVSLNKIPVSVQTVLPRARMGGVNREVAVFITALTPPSFGTFVSVARGSSAWTWVVAKVAAKRADLNKFDIGGLSSKVNIL